MTVEIVCAGCGADTMVKREPVYDGFKRIGERFVCVSCGHVYASEESVPFKKKREMAVFSDADKSPQPRIFKSDDLQKNCRHCEHYVVNPFTQRCGLHGRVVEATDICGQFEAKDKPEVGS
ncbi:MAG: hypothetical protein FJ224_08850 [Lentisphaerae bacterium]|nr:hypothetical protein [Lentisphaerota bacterium]